MEVVREITSISHDGYNEMWHPLYIENELHCKFINCLNYTEGLALTGLVLSMFATNNHNSNITSDFLIDRMHSTGLINMTQCSIEFNTEKDSYVLSRVFEGNRSIEAKLVSRKNKTVVFGQNALNKLQKMTTPIAIPGARSFNSRSYVFKPDCENSRLNLLKMTKRWSEMLDCNEGLSYRLSPMGEWTFFDLNRSRRYTADTTTPSIITLLSTLAQAAIRTRKFGYCPSIVFSLNIDDLNEFEINSLIDLVSNICIEERLNVLITTHLPAKIDNKFVANTSTM